ncbi:Zinc finger protein 629 [Eumeta japonica]|uniref:Zinc finger protein 629 n=1 Tax=Eumeta variegata TaxID=151549 RepID=A0A4C1VJL4_EUMVA|nr:Zinc finger protein 629 [Eumeta japonica]
MLSPSHVDDDDDSHLCIKCNATIVGLDNYIKHRKERCGKQKYPSINNMKVSTPKTNAPPLGTIEPTYSLGADVFFQSLELQSSVKKSSLSRLTPPMTITNKPSSERKLTSLTVTSTGDIPRVSPLDSTDRGSDWIGGHTLKIVGNEDNQTKLINAVASISGAPKKEIPSSSYSIPYNDFKNEEESDDTSEETEDEDDDDAPGSSNKWKPPPHHTGGKWRPASPDHEDWEMRDESEHTGGKWRLLIAQDSNDRDEDYDAPPPGHTKGKWVPGASEQKTQIMQTTIQTKDSVQYWCGPCNRRLRSRAIYEKHLLSKLHMKKVLPENDLEFSGHLEPAKSPEKRTSRPSLSHRLYSDFHSKNRNFTSTNDFMILKKKRKRKPFFVHCSGCKSRVRSHLMGKHLISHYHFRKATDIHSNVYHELILNNIDAIIHQSPFQCSPCKFYTNWLSNFMQHWFSDDHEKRMAAIEGRYWCSFCKFECEQSEEMLEHLTSSDHNEVVAAVNRSMPIIIRKKTILKCYTCYKEFRYNIEIKRHCMKTGHEPPYTASDTYQELHKCEKCNLKFKSSLTLAAHLKNQHKQKAYVCLLCRKTFNTSLEAKYHRQTSEHRIRQKEKLRERGVDIKDMSKKCPHCVDKTVILKNILDLKDHIRLVHPEIKRRCPKCGMAFLLSQEVTRHVRSGACQFKDHAGPSTILWNCSQCLFKTDSQAECLFHEVLHSEPSTRVAKYANTKRVIEKYTCPFCPKSFVRASLRYHIRQHTFERPCVCTVCSANFTRVSTLANHCKIAHGLETSTNINIVPKRRPLILAPPETSRAVIHESGERVLDDRYVHVFVIAGRRVFEST